VRRRISIKVRLVGMVLSEILVPDQTSQAPLKMSIFV